MCPLIGGKFTPPLKVREVRRGYVNGFSSFDITPLPLSYLKRGT